MFLHENMDKKKLHVKLYNNDKTVPLIIFNFLRTNQKVCIEKIHF